jgi:hypothetical protein
MAVPCATAGACHALLLAHHCTAGSGKLLCAVLPSLHHPSASRFICLLLTHNTLCPLATLQKLGLDSAAGQKDDSGDQAGGIILKRQPKAGSGAKGAGSDLGAMRDMVQKLCQSSMPLARYVDSLQVRPGGVPAFLVR